MLRFMVMNVFFVFDEHLCNYAEKIENNVEVENDNAFGMVHANVG